jgi:hypothetical protein
MSYINGDDENINQLNLRDITLEQQLVNSHYQGIRQHINSSKDNPMYKK